MKIASRDEIPGLLRERGLNGFGVEVGVQRGVYSATLLRGSDLSRLYSVDTWQTKLAGLEYYVESVRNLDEFGLRSVLLRMTSLEAAKLFAPQSLDFVYVDADHEYKSVAADIAAWWPKLKVNGILAGHDYCDYHAGVIKAVDEFTSANGLTFELTALDRLYKEHRIRSWLIEKKAAV